MRETPAACNAGGAGSRKKRREIREKPRADQKFHLSPIFRALFQDNAGLSKALNGPLSSTLLLRRAGSFSGSANGSGSDGSRSASVDTTIEDAP